MKDIVADTEMIAYCGLYCGACRAYLKGRCPGCRETTKAQWCGVRTCCIEAGFSSCADCEEFPNPKDCVKYNNLVARIFGFVFRSDRSACIKMIRQSGYETFAQTMTERKAPTVRR